MTERPACASATAADSPLGPAPTTMASGVAAISLLYRCFSHERIPSTATWRACRGVGGAAPLGLKMMQELSGYWYSRWFFERGLAIMYLVAFLVGAWAGIALSLVALSGIAARFGALPSAAVWAGLYVLYLSYINAGQTWYGFGWESLLVEIGFFTIFAGASFTPPAALLNWIYRWTLFRLMFGAGLVKLRGDECWRALTCLDYFFETQPMPNALSWYFHHLPRQVLHGGVAFNHFVELVVPFGFFLPQPYAGLAGLFTIVFQFTLIAGGN